MKENSIPALDRVDQAILRILQRNGRLTNAEVANRANISAATCHRRTQKMLKSGLITAFRAQVEPKAVGLGVLVMVAVVLDRSTPESFADFEQAVTTIEEILDCHLVSGDFDYLLKIRVRDIADFNLLHSKRLLALPGIRQARSFFVLKEVKENAPLPF